MSVRPPWVPNDVEDEDVERWADSLGGNLARLEWEARKAGDVGLSAKIDQVRAGLRDETERLVAKFFRS